MKPHERTAKVYTVCQSHGFEIKIHIFYNADMRSYTIMFVII